MGLSLTTVAIIIFALYILSSIKILAEYERGVIFRLGRLLPNAKGPGIILVFAPIDRMVRISLRQEALEVPPQDIITRDNVTLKVNAVIFLRVIDPNKAVVEVSNYVYQTSQFAQTTLRSVLGEQELDELLATEPVSVQLRYLQTLTEIGVEKNTTVVFPVPVDIFSGVQKMLGKSAGDGSPSVAKG